MSEQKGLSRRNFLVGAGLTTGALAALGVGAGTASAAYTALPWAYNTLNLTTVKRRGYDGYYAGGCMYGTATALIQTLIETVGAPWDTLPFDLFKYGGGGVNSWGSTCGALNGAAWVIQACAGTNATAVINDLFQWYCNFSFPSKDHEAYCVYARQKTSISNNPLCHASSSNWCYTARFKVSSAQRKDRCAKLAGDVAGKTAELLNAVKAGTFVPTFVQPDPTCSGCHVGANSTYDTVQMKSTCTTYCHVPGKKGGDMPTH